jgi:hypothetical protein
MPGFHDIRQLAYLNDIEGVQFELYGGAAFRFALQQDRGDAVVDLFDLAPFTTDIDLVHLGSTTPRVFQQILNTCRMPIVFGGESVRNPSSLQAFGRTFLLDRSR